MSNKKFSRSKKSDGGNVPNFVFNFSGSQPGSPLASPGGFSSTPGSPAQTGINFGSNTSQSFSFGDSAAPASTTPNSSFNFNTASTTNSPFNTKRGQSELDLSAPERNPIRRAASDSAFGAPTSSSSQPFTFGANTATSGLTSQLSFGSTGSQSSNISFSTPAATPPNTSSTPSGLSFGAPVTSTNPSAPSGISFGTPATIATAANTSSTPSVISFGTPATTNTAAPASSTTTHAPAITSTTGFSFGSASTTATGSTSAAAPTSAFSFGTPASTTSATSTPTPSSFGFGASTTTPSSTTATTTTTITTAEKSSTSAPSSGFSFGSTPAIVTSTPAASSSTGFSFGKPADTTTKSAKPTLNFGLSSTSTAPSSSTTTTTTNTPTTTTTTSAADKPATSTTAPVSSSSVFTFGAPKTTSAPTLNFGTPSASTTSTPAVSTSTSTTTTSSASTTAAPTAPTTSLFSLGTVNADKDGKKAGTVTSTPLLFGAGAAAPTIPAADPNKPNVFSFSKILEDLRKVEAQPPHQMYASLITPALAALQQNQIVSHTSFRIDNILPTTRFSELPEQAQKELDELEKYVRLEAQRCEYIGNQKAPKHLEAMEKSSKDTEALSQQLDALTSTLKIQMESIESFYESVKTQLRHANEGCAVIEACKHPGDNARWLFGHSEEDDYFSLLAKQLHRRLEEYKKCIWEIERTAESWTHNRMQSPQDVADIMRAQNQAFLALSNKVAALHESVNVEMNYYNQYLRMCS